MTLKPVWTSATFLQYAGMLLAVFSTGWLFDFLQNEHGTWGLFGWAVLFAAVILAVALAVDRRGEPVLAGLVAFLAVFCFAVVVGAFFEAVGLIDENDEGPLAEGLDFWLFVVELVVLVIALAALSRFRHPLLGLAVALVVWAFAVDLLGDVFGGGGRAHAFAVILVGLAFAARAAGMDRDAPSPTAFWVHLIAALSVGGGVIWFLHDADWHWVVVGLVALVFVRTARRWGRASYAVVAAIGFAWMTTNYVVSLDPFLGLFLPFGVTDPVEGLDPWVPPFAYLSLGVFLTALGLWATRRPVTETAT